MFALLIFILILSLLIVVHELGHFVMARRHGVRVEEFGFGIPPKLISKKVGETIYSLNLLPFGGFVRLTGEDSVDSAEAEADPRNYMSKTPSQRLSILLAGVFMNVILALALFYTFFFINGFKSMTLPVLFDYNFKFGHSKFTNTVITGFADESAGLLAGLTPGDAILEVNDEPVYSVADIRTKIKYMVAEPVRLLVMNVSKGESDLHIVMATPAKDENGDGVLGVYLSKSVVVYYDTPTERIFAGFLHSYNMLDYSIHTLKGMAGLSFKEKDIEPLSQSVAGPVGIYSIIKLIVGEGGKSAVLSLLDLTALMSLSLALVNILPFPALDGGRALFVLVEKARGKRVSSSFENAVHKWGMIFLLGFIVLITVKDVLRIFG